MSNFLRPRAPAFGISFDADRDDTTHYTQTPGIADQRPISERRRRLPIFHHRTEILFLLQQHQTTIIVGETGSGKTTQVPQYLYESGWAHNGRIIACTQPRRVAAMTVAARVAEELGCRLGQTVGYSIRFEDVSTEGVTKIRFVTDGVLLREMSVDPLLLKYSVIMVDEAHERSIATDLLLGLLKKIQKRRLDLRIIISSATMEAEHMAQFFTLPTQPRRPPALLSVEGRTHHVEIHYLKQPASDYIKSAVEAAIELHLNEVPGDILIFLTGQEECEKAVEMLEEEQRRLKSSSYLKNTLLPLPLYAGLSATHQLAVFEPTPRNHRKIVVATNVAETSVTIEGVVYVIDCLFSKQRCFNPLTGLESLLVAPISKASAMQRAGRAGRVRPGHCFRLAPEEDYERLLPKELVPEIQRSNLAGSLLQLKSLGIDNVMHFDWLASPPAETVVRGLETLHALGALGNDVALTHPIGVQMSELPLEPVLGRMILSGAVQGCASEVATVVAMLSVHSIWWSGGNRKALFACQAKFSVAEGDVITYLNVWRGWEESKRSKKWAVENHVNHRTLLRVADIRRQLGSYLGRMGCSVMSTGAKDILTVRKALASGMFINAARLTDEITLDDNNNTINVYRLVRSAGGAAAHARLKIHPSSVLYRCRPKWVCFYTAQQNESGWYEMQDVLTIEPEWLTEVAPHMYQGMP